MAVKEHVWPRGPQFSGTARLQRFGCSGLNLDPPPSVLVVIATRFFLMVILVFGLKLSDKKVVSAFPCNE